MKLPNRWVYKFLILKFYKILIKFPSEKVSEVLTLYDFITTSSPALDVQSTSTSLTDKKNGFLPLLKFACLGQVLMVGHLYNSFYFTANFWIIVSPWNSPLEGYQCSCLQDQGPHLTRTLRAPSWQHLTPRTTTSFQRHCSFPCHDNLLCSFSSMKGKPIFSLEP